MVFVVVTGLLASVAPKVVLAHDPETITKNVYEDRVVPVYEDFWKETVRVPNYAPGSLSFRIAARKTANSRVEIALQPRVGNTWGAYKYPSKRFFPLSTAIGKWLYTSTVTVGFTETTYRTETRYRKITDPPPNKYTVISKQKVRRQTGTTTIQEKTGTTTVTTHDPHDCKSGYYKQPFPQNCKSSKGIPFYKPGGAGCVFILK